MAFKNVTDCPIDAPEDPYGAYSNAIRLSSDGNDVLIDFCVYSETENRARVVSRVRVAQAFLPVILQKIEHDLNLSVPGHVDKLFVMPAVRGNN